MNWDDKIAQVQKSLKAEALDGWLIADFRKSNDLACRFLGMPEELMLTRRLYYWIPQEGSPIKLVHSIEAHVLDKLPGKKVCYRRWQELEHQLKQILGPCKRVAMEYSPRNAIPYLAKVDAGTVELVRSFGPEVHSSANILQAASSVLSPEQAQSHFYATSVLDGAVNAAWDWIAEHLQQDKALTDYQVQQFIMQRFAEADCITEGEPIVAVNGDAADPHYTPSAQQQVPIRKGDFVLIDLWCKKSAPGAIYGDICRVGVAAAQPTKKQQEVFDVVHKAQATAFALVESRCRQAQDVHGWEVDKAARDVIEAAGYGDYFTHRTGHNIYVNDHGDGAHIDNFETQDKRKLLPSTCFSIEPGIYLPGEFGVRLEYDVYIHPDRRVEITGGQQDSIRCLVGHAVKSSD